MDQAVNSNRMLDKIMATIGDLPATPAIIARLMNLTADINTDIEKITKAIMADQSLAAKVLKMSNSSFYGRAREVKTLKEAVMILGFMTLHSLVIATTTQTMYQKTVDGGTAGKLWEHGFASAIASRLIAQISGFHFIEEAFVAGLLHDIGKLVLVQKIPTDFRQIVAEVEARQASFAVVEEAAFGFTHAQVGSLLLQKWSFPEELIAAVERHHLPTEAAEADRKLTCIINAGNFLAKTLEVGFDDYAVDDLSELESIAALDLDPANLDEIQTTIKEQFEEEKELFTLEK
jgi:putative nucleotidyltransferase with HDIG domain